MGRELHIFGLKDGVHDTTKGIYDGPEANRTHIGGWWYVSLGIPQNLLPILILMKDDQNAFPSDLYNRLIIDVQYLMWNVEKPIALR